MYTPPLYIETKQHSQNISSTGVRCAKCGAATVMVSPQVGDADGIHRCTVCHSLNVDDSSVIPNRQLLLNYLLHKQWTLWPVSYGIN